METVHKALREGELVKDTYQRVSCGTCEQTLKREDDPDRIGAVRVCPDCSVEWKQIR